MVVEHIRRIGELGLRIAEDAPRLGRLVGAVERHPQLDATQDGARVEFNGLCEKGIRINPNPEYRSNALWSPLV